MGLLEDVAAKVKATLGADSAAGGMVDHVLAYLHDSQSGGLQGLVQQFTQSGLGQQVQSWISTGKNMPITPEQIQKALGTGVLAKLAAKAGVTPEEVSQRLSRVLPHVVDHLSPTGQLPTPPALDQLGGFLKGKLGG